MDSREMQDWRAASRAAREGRTDTAKARWERRHMRSETARFTVAEDAELRAACLKRGITRHALIRELLKEWLVGLKSREEMGLIAVEDIPPMTMEQLAALAEWEAEKSRKWEEENDDEDAFDGYM